MNSIFGSLFPLMAAPPAGSEGAAGAAGGGMIGTLIPFALIIFIFYFLIIRPQNKKQKETQKMLSALKKGDKIITIGGIHGSITKVKDNTVVVKVDDGTEIEFSRSAVSNVETASSGSAQAAPAAPASTGSGEKKGLLGGLFGSKKKEEAVDVTPEAASPASSTTKESENSSPEEK
jgi:preprotein translocase subunit YajC